MNQHQGHWVTQNSKKHIWSMPLCMYREDSLFLWNTNIHLHVHTPLHPTGSMLTKGERFLYWFWPAKDYCMTGNLNFFTMNEWMNKWKNKGWASNNPKTMTVNNLFCIPFSILLSSSLAPWMKIKTLLYSVLHPLTILRWEPPGLLIAYMWQPRVLSRRCSFRSWRPRAELSVLKSPSKSDSRNTWILLSRPENHNII
jgi:hypothetical protein